MGRRSHAFAYLRIAHKLTVAELRGVPADPTILDLMSFADETDGNHKRGKQEPPPAPLPLPAPAPTAPTDQVLAPSSGNSPPVSGVSMRMALEGEATRPTCNPAPPTFAELGHIWLVPGGPELGQARRKKLCQLVRAHKGEMGEMYKSKVTRLIVASSRLTSVQIGKHAGGQKRVPCGAQIRAVVTPQWLQDALDAFRAAADRGIEPPALPAFDGYLWTEPPPPAPPELLKGKQQLKRPREAVVQGAGQDNKRAKAGGKGSHYACMLSGTLESANLNEHITRFFDPISSIYEILREKDRHWGFKKASAALKSWPKKILSPKDVDEFKSAKKGIGDSIALCMREIVQFGFSQRLASLQAREGVSTMLAFKEIWGVGPKTAQDLVKAGYKSIADLRQRGLKSLNEKQRIGLERYEDLLERIPRSEVEEIEAYVRSVAEAILPKVNLTTCGSYRRGKATCGDVDILLAPPHGETYCHRLLKELVRRLFEKEFLTDQLAFEQSRDRDSFMGICRLPGEGRLHRRIDIKAYSRHHYAFAILYFTGSDHFNRSMRSYAKREKKMRLSDTSLRPINYIGGREMKTMGDPVPCTSEEDIFKALGLQYKAPHERNCFDEAMVADEREELEEMELAERRRDSRRKGAHAFVPANC